MQPTNGTRFEFVLAEHVGDEATYDVEIANPAAVAHVRVHVAKRDGEWTAARVGVASASTTRRDAREAEASGGASVQPAIESQLIALARTIGRHRERDVWPRRITRWRQPGVR